MISIRFEERQQIGLQYTTASKAGFISSLYVVLVPLIGLLLGRKPEKGVWIGVPLSVLGMYLIAVGVRHSRNIVCRRVVVDIINIEHFSRSLAVLCYNQLIILNLEHRLAISSPHF